MKLPVTISTKTGEELTFLRITTNETGQEILEVENKVAPKAGPPMHIHWKQDECLTVVTGKLGYQVLGEEVKYAGPGETVMFKRGVAHKFWNDGDDTMRCTGWISPPNNIIYFLAEIYKSSDANNGRPGSFDAAFLLNRYRSEFDMVEIPGFVKKVIFPVSLFVGKLQGKHKKFRDAPEPVI